MVMKTYQNAKQQQQTTLKLKKCLDMNKLRKFIILC